MKSFTTSHRIQVLTTLLFNIHPMETSNWPWPYHYHSFTGHYTADCQLFLFCRKVTFVNWKSQWISEEEIFAVRRLSYFLQVLPTGTSLGHQLTKLIVPHRFLTMQRPKKYNHPPLAAVISKIKILNNHNNNINSIVRLNMRCSALSILLESSYYFYVLLSACVE